MVKILILANNDIGLYKFRKELIQKLINQDNDVFFSVPDGEMVPPLVDLGGEFINTSINRRGINPFTDLKLLFTYILLLRRTKPNLVITYTVKPNVFGGIACRVLNIPYAINITGLGTAFQNEGILKKIITIMYKASCKKAKVVFFENMSNRQLFIDNKIVNENKACRLNGAGVNLEEYQFCEYPADKIIRFLFIGRVMKEKGIDELIEAASRIKQKYKNIVFDIIGPFEENYEEKILELQSMGIIQYHGFQKDVKPYIKEANCFVLPSYHEGMANTLLECGAMGRPLITSNVNGCMEAVIDGESGFLVNVKSSQSLYEKLKQFIELSYEEKAFMGQASNLHIQNTFDKNKVIKKTIWELQK